MLGDDGSGYTSDIIQGLDWCVANGIQVASMSFGGGGTLSLQAACDRAYAQGVVLVAAAGNEAAAVTYPAAYPSVIAVAATDARNVRASFSNSGPQITLAAPGVDIYSTYKGGSYANMSGTSMACPHVSGAAALAWASGLTSATAVRERLIATAEDLGIVGFDTSYGYGLVDAERAAAGAAPADKPPTVGITVPLPGSTISKTVVVQATADDDKGVAQVEFLVDGATLGVDTQGSDGWSVSWNTTRSVDGQHIITATAKDTAGQTASNSATVTVRNAAPPQTGTMSVSSITYSTSRSRLGSFLDLNVAVHVVDSAGKPVANAYVWANLYLNGRIFMTPAGATNASGAFLFKVIRAPAGSYKTTVVRVSAQGRTWEGVTPPNGFAKPF